MVTEIVSAKCHSGSMRCFVIENRRGVRVTLLGYGATLYAVSVPVGGETLDILLGDMIRRDSFYPGDAYIGASIGRFAGRIPDAVLRIHDDVFPLCSNEGSNQLHGGVRGFDKHIWKAEPGEDSVTFTIVSPDGDQGFPGKCRCSATYALSDDALTITYRGVSDRVTAWNPTNHGYWNLNGHAAGDTRGHRLLIPADRYVPVDADMLPTCGEADVDGTRFDFRTLREIGGAYDNSFLLSGGPILLWGDRGIGLEITTDCTAVQFYNAQFLTSRRGKGGATYHPFGAVCLETQGRQTLRGASVFEENILYPGEEKTRTTRFRFLYKED